VCACVCVSMCAGGKDACAEVPNNAFQTCVRETEREEGCMSERVGTWVRGKREREAEREG